MSEEYQGWTNRETWAIALWINDSPRNQRFAQQLAQSEGSDHVKAQALQEQVRSVWEDMRGVQGFVADVINAAFARVDWKRLIEHFSEE